MCLRKLILIGCLPVTLFTASAVFARPLSGGYAEACVFDEHTPLASAPFFVEEDFGLGGFTSLRGTALFVAAEPGLTAEWLKIRLDRELETTAPLLAEESCRPSLGVTAEVVSARNGFWIVYMARDARAAKSLVRWGGEIVATYRARDKYEDYIPRDYGKNTRAPVRY